jgi:hypothetical protein
MKFLKFILPPLVAFGVFAAIIRYNPLKYSLAGFSTIGDGSAYGLITYYKVFAPFQFIIALLTQYLITLPFWNRILTHPRSAIGVFVGITLICFVLALGISYMIWDPQTGTRHLIHITLFMTGVQLFYWLINFAVLFLLDIRKFFKHNKQEQQQDTE